MKNTKLNRALFALYSHLGELLFILREDKLKYLSDYVDREASKYYEK